MKRCAGGRIGGVFDLGTATYEHVSIRMVSAVLREVAGLFEVDVLKMEHTRSSSKNLSGSSRIEENYSSFAAGGISSTLQELVNYQPYTRAKHGFDSSYWTGHCCHCLSGTSI